MDKDFVLDIIKCAGQSGVSRLKFEGLELEYGSNTPEPQQVVAVLPPTKIPTDAPTIERAEDPENGEERKTRESIEQILKEEMMANLQLSNPYEYELLMAQGELENVGPESSQSSEA